MRKREGSGTVYKQSTKRKRERKRERERGGGRESERREGENERAREKHVQGRGKEDGERERVRLFFWRLPNGCRNLMQRSINLYKGATLRQDPLDLSFWSFLTFLGIEKVDSHLL